MMKLSVAFLAALATADAARTHGRRHARRDNYGGYEAKPQPSKEVSPSSSAPAAYVPSSSATPVTPASTSPAGGYPVGTPPVKPEASSSALPYTGASSSAPLGGEYGSGSPSSSAPVVPASSSPLPYGGTAVLPSSSAPVYEVPSSSSAFPTYSPTGAYPGVPYPGSSEVPYPGTSGVPVKDQSSGLPYPSGGKPSGYPSGYPSSSGSLPTSTPKCETKVIQSTQIYPVTESSSVRLHTTVYPVTVTVTPSGYATPTSKYVEVQSTPVGEKVYTTTKTLVYTVGSGDNKHETTTVVENKVTSTIYHTVHVTKTPTSPYATKESEEEEITGTTTISSTSTTTKVITVYPTPSAEGYPVKPVGSGVGEQCAPPVTVTVTAQETVTVTAGSETYPTKGPQGEGYPTKGHPTKSVVEGEHKPTSKPAGSYPTGYPEVPYPYPGKNSTALPYPTGPSSGFVTLTVYPTPVASSTGVAYPTVSTFVFPSSGVPVKPSSSAPAGYPVSSVPVKPSSSTPAEYPGASSSPAVPVKPSSSAPAGYPVYTPPAAVSSTKVVPAPSSTPANNYGSYYRR